MSETIVDLNTRIQLRDDIAHLFTQKYSHLPATELISEAAAMYVVVTLLSGYDQEVVQDLVGEAYDNLSKHEALIQGAHLAANLPDGTPEA